jgi:hypothetical protein
VARRREHRGWRAINAVLIATTYSYDFSQDTLGDRAKWICGAKKQVNWLVYSMRRYESATNGKFYGSSRTSPLDFRVELAHRTID